MRKMTQFQNRFFFAHIFARVMWALGDLENARSWCPEVHHLPPFSLKTAFNKAIFLFPPFFFQNARQET
jgi:hypothetical protein